MFKVNFEQVNTGWEDSMVACKWEMSSFKASDQKTYSMILNEQKREEMVANLLSASILSIQWKLWNGS